MADYSDYPERVQCDKRWRVRITVEQWNDKDQRDLCNAYFYSPEMAKRGRDPWRDIEYASWGRHPETKREQFDIELASGKEFNNLEPSFPIYVSERSAAYFQRG